MKNILSCLSFITIVLSVQSQILYDFSNNPLSEDWSYYDNYGSSPTAGFSYNSTNQSINYALGTGTEISIFHRELPATLRNNYCVSFQITPTSSGNYNTFFPLLLSPVEITGTHLHPWRQNAPNPYTSGPHQNMDLLGIEVFGNQIRFVHRNDNVTGSTTIQSLNPQFDMQANMSYWVQLEVINSTTVDVQVFANGNFVNNIAQDQFTIPVLEDMNHLFIANCNGNSNTNQYGLLDNYRINQCLILELEEPVESFEVLELNLYPNPASSKITVEIPNLKDHVIVEIVDHQGRIVHTTELETFESLEINCSDFCNGSYIIRVISTDQIIAKRFVKND